MIGICCEFVTNFFKWFHVTVTQPLLLVKDYVLEKWSKSTQYAFEDEEDLRGKTVVITGSNSGIGKEATFEFAKRGAVVVMACRDIPKAESVIQEVKDRYPDSKLILVELDLGDLTSIRKCAAEIRSKCEKIDVLVNNAGCLFTSGKLKKTADGFEIHMGINYLGHFLLTNLLLDLVTNAAPSRIVFTGSSLHLTADLDLEDLMLEKRGYFGIRNFGPYSNSKLALLYFATELSKRLKGKGVNVYTFCPGYVNTDVFRHETFLERMFTRVTLFLAAIPVEQACETMMHCSSSKKLANESGKMYRFGKPYNLVNNDIEKFDQEVILSLWEISEHLTGATFLSQD